MGKAGYVLKQVLEQYNITQYRLAANLGIDRTAEVRGSNPLFSILKNTSNLRRAWECCLRRFSAPTQATMERLGRRLDAKRRDE
jgi:hypothetical protein